jgi:hypothetical protein
VRADFMVIFEVRFENLPQLLLIEHDYSVQAFTSNRTLSLDIIPYWLIPWAFGLIKEGV